MFNDESGSTSCQPPTLNMGFNGLSKILVLQTVTPEAVLLWAQRAIQDYDKKVGKNSTTKQKAGFPKQTCWSIVMLMVDNDGGWWLIMVEIDGY